MFKKKLAVLSRRLRKAAVVVLMVGANLLVFGLLVLASHTAVQAATRHGHSWIGWAAVVVFWLILIAAGIGMGSSGNNEKGKEGNN